MKRFITTIILFFLPIFVSLAIIEYEMQHIPNVYSYKCNWLTNNISTIRIWIFGSSHSYYGLSPKCFSKPAFNSAHVGQTLPYDEFIFNKFIDDADSLECVILPISYFTMPFKLDAGPEWWRAKNYCLYYDCPYFGHQIKYHCEILGNPLPLYKQIGRIWNYWINGKDDVNCDSLGFITQQTDKSKDWLMTGPATVKNHTKDLKQSMPIIDANKIALENIVSTCQKKGISVLLLTTPVHKSYYELINQEQYHLMLDICEAFETQFDNVHYLNLFKNDQFIDDDFYDKDHLNYSGAVKLSQIVDNYITQMNR